MIENIITNSLSAELSISANQITGMSGIEERRQTGSFYTPADAAKAMWLNIIHMLNVKKNKQDLIAWLKKSHFIEPASGTGIFVFTLIHLLMEHDLTYDDVLPNLKFTAVDINKGACEFFTNSLNALLPISDIANGFETKIEALNRDGVDFLRSIHDGNFKLEGQPVIIGNPPYVRLDNSYDISSVDPGFIPHDLYALFLYWSAKVAHKYSGCFGLIVPLSVTFSNHYEELRNSIFQLQPKLFLSHYDNMPDAIFSSGKPDSKNTNKANSQRVTYYCGVFEGKNSLSIHSSRLLAWRRSERASILSSVPKTYKVMPWGNKQIIPKPFSLRDKRLLKSKKSDLKLLDLVSKSGEYSVWVSVTARNYLSVGLDKFKATGIKEIKFNNHNHAMVAFLLLASRTFLEYWRCVGDGFHVTANNIYEFPLRRELFEKMSDVEILALSLWGRRQEYMKHKSNSGHLVKSYDFTEAEEVMKLDLILDSVL